MQLTSCDELPLFVQPSEGLRVGDNDSLMVINNYELIKAETIDRIDEVFTTEKSLEAVYLLTNTSFDSYWTKTKQSYAKSPFFTDLEETVRQKESEWRRARSKEIAAKSNIEQDDPDSYLAIQHHLSISRAETNTRQSEKLTALAALNLHRKKAFDLKKQRMKYDAEERKRRKESKSAARKRKQ
jgi:hypothetical protein